MQLRKDSNQATISPNMEEMLEDVKHSRALPNTRGYQDDQPLDAAGATCCALLRPLPQEQPPDSRRPRTRKNSHPPKR